ncbi:hypothetical protein PLICRDRAFT_177771 [Plicaturopsis crispa FD-325 SS-3]|nr:hypothetical protein PLICRDRAFT_177771 [Plicaturopsis crispa FD-325 SS-3]
MHRCLSINEILLMVCHELLDYRFMNHLKTRDVARLARTCRAFHEPALDLIWYELDSLGPLVRTFPADLWEQREVVDEDGGDFTELALIRPIHPSDWTRFQFYARRIRRLDFIPEICNMEAGVMSAIHASTPSLPLLPSLRELVLEAEDTEGVAPHVTHMLLHPALSRVSIGCRTAEAVRVSVILALPDACPALEVLEIPSFGNKDAIISAAVDRVVGRWCCLTELTVPHLSSDAMVTVAALPVLRFLVIQKFEATAVEKTSFPAFPALRDLSIEGAPAMADCIAFISLLKRGHCLKTLRLSLSEKRSVISQWQDFFKIIAERCSPTTLSSVVITDLETQHTRHEEISVIGVITPLLAFPHMTTFSVAFPDTMPLDDLTLKTIAVAWPRIEVLHLVRPHSTMPRKPGISPDGLAHLVTTCHHLCDLALAFDASSVRSALPVHGRWNTNLRALNVGLSKVTDISGTAAFLSAICPNICELYSEPRLNWPATDRDANVDRWQDVSKLLRDFCAVRMQERAAAEVRYAGNHGAR